MHRLSVLSAWEIMQAQAYAVEIWRYLQLCLFPVANGVWLWQSSEKLGFMDG